MADRTPYDERSRRQGRQGRYDRQQEQFQPERDFDDDNQTGQLGDSWRETRDQDTSWRSERDRDRAYLGERSENRYGTSGYGAARYSPREGRSFDTFTGSDFGGRDFTGSSQRSYGRESYGGGAYGAGNYGAGSQLAANHGEWREPYGSTPSRENRDYRDTWGGRSSHDDRGFLERASDTVAGWFHDDDDDRRRNRGHRGTGPKNYTRSDDRICEDANDALTDDWGVDARNIQVSVKDSEITLDGTVPSRDQKRRAEDCVEDLSGVRHVQNNLRVQERSNWDRNNSGETDTTTA